MDLVFWIEDPAGRELFVVDLFRTESVFADVDPNLVHRRILDDHSLAVTVQSEPHRGTSLSRTGSTKNLLRERAVPLKPVGGLCEGDGPRGGEEPADAHAPHAEPLEFLGAHVG